AKLRWPAGASMASTPLVSADDVRGFIDEYFDAWSGTDEDRILGYYSANLPDVRMIFQSQFNDIVAVRLDLKKVSRLCLEPTIAFRLEAEFKGTEIVLYPLGKLNSHRSEIRAGRAEYQMLGSEFRGRSYHLIQDEREDEISE